MKTDNQRLFRVRLVFSRTLYSQSVASVTMGSLAACLRSFGQHTDLCLVGTGMLHNTEVMLENSDQHDIVIAKPNFKDFRAMLLHIEYLKTSGLAQRVFLCGPFARLNAKSLMSRLVWLDGIFVDQPEASVIGLLPTMSEDLMSWDFQSLGSISRNPITGVVGVYRPIREPIPLSELPFPVRDIEAKERASFVNIEASRGCLFDCSFCHIPLMSSTSVRSLSLNIREPELVVDEIEWLNKEMGKTLFIFNDNCFWSTKKDDTRILCFCEEVAKRKLDVHFYVYLKGEPFIGDEIIRALAGAGLVRVFLGVENSVKSTLTTYRKKIKPNLYETVKAKLDALGVNVHIGFITIEPHSSLDDVLSNVEYLYSIGKLFRLGVILEPVRIVPGTSLHKHLIGEGLMSSELDYDEIIYGYKFVHEEVGCLSKAWKKMFEGHLKGIAYGFEYHSTTGELLKVLAGRFDPILASLLKNHYDAFNAMKLRGMNTLLGYFRTSIESVRVGKVHLVGDIEHNQQFVDEFTRIAAELAILHNGLITVIKQNGGDRIVREVYTCQST